MNLELLIWPGALAQRADLYAQLAMMLSAGVTLTKALATAARTFPAERARVQQWLGTLEAGGTFADALAAQPSVSRFEAALLETGERSGRLDACLTMLAKYYTQASQLSRRVLTDLAYPLLVFHAAVFIAPFPQLFLTGNVGGYLWATLGLLLPIYGIVWALVALTQSDNPRVRSDLERIALAVPLLGPAVRELALARLASALEALLNAGVLVHEAWQIASGASGSEAIRREIRSWGPKLAEGQTPGELLLQSRFFPFAFAQGYRTGEISGQLDRALARLAGHFQEEANRRFHLIAEWTPRVVYGVVVIYVASRILNLAGAAF